MSREPDLDDLLAPFDREALRAALLEAYRRGEAAMRDSILKAVQHVAPEAALPAARNLMSSSRAVHQLIAESEDASRAPRGLTREVITMILDEADALTTSEIQTRALDLDDRLSEKTVYNELNREKGKLYRLSMGRWSLMTRPDPMPNILKEDVI